jgi:hypothetical protein
MANGFQQASSRRRTDDGGPVGLILVLEPGERLAGTVGHMGESEHRSFSGWVDLMGAIDWLRAGNGKDHGAP